MTRTGAIEDHKLPDDGNNWAPAFERAQAAVGPDGVVEFTRQAEYRITSPLVLTTRVRIQGIGGMGPGARNKIRALGCSGLHVVFPGHPDYPDAVGGWASMEDVTLLGGGWDSGGDHHGVLMERACNMRNVHVEGFSGRGIEVHGDVHATPKTGANVVLFERVRTYTTGLSGWVFRGGDANQCELYGCFADRAGQRAVEGDNHGFWDDSFLGNQFFGCHSDMGGNNPTGRSYLAIKHGSANFFGCYSEGHRAEILAPNYAFGGMMAKHPDGLGVDGVLRSTSGMRMTSLELAPDGPRGVSGRLARKGTDEVIHFWSTQDPHGYKLIKGPNGTLAKTWPMVHQGLSSRCAFALTDVTHDRGPGFTSFPRGALIGTVRHGGGTAPPSTSTTADPWRAGDIYWNASASSPERWRCVAVGPDGGLTWEPKP